MKKRNPPMSKALQAGLDAIKTLAPQDELKENPPAVVAPEAQVLTSQAFLKELHTEFLSILPENISFVPRPDTADTSKSKSWEVTFSDDEKLTSDLAKTVANLFAANLVNWSEERQSFKFFTRLFVGNHHYRDKNVVFSFALWPNPHQSLMVQSFYLEIEAV